MYLHTFYNLHTIIVWFVMNNLIKENSTQSNRFRIERIAIDAKWQSQRVSTLAINPSSLGLRPNHRNLGSPEISQRPVSSGLKLKLCNVRANTGTALLWIFRIHVGNCSEITLHTLHSTITWRLCLCCFIL